MTAKKKTPRPATNADSSASSAPPSVETPAPLTPPLLDAVRVTDSERSALLEPLANWLTLQSVMPAWDEATLLRAMVAERAGRNRLSILQRIYARFTKVRREREQREIFYSANANATPHENPET